MKRSRNLASLEAVKTIKEVATCRLVKEACRGQYFRRDLPSLESQVWRHGNFRHSVSFFSYGEGAKLMVLNLKL